MAERLSLTDLQQGTAGLHSGDSRAWDGSATPTQAELAECLFFSPGDGRIWLNDQRMLLMHASSFGALRRELIGALGQERARGLLTRVGYLSGVRDAELVRKRWPQADAAAIFAAGTRLHGLEGLVRVEPLHFEFDVDQGRYGGEFLWHHSAECDEHLIAHGQGSDPACWMETGYAIGYVSSLFGRLVIFREVECRAMGHGVCRVEGRNAERWPNVAEDLRYLNAAGVDTPDSVSERLPASLPLAAADQPLVGASAAFNTAFRALQRVAPTPATVLLTGESGVGKELFASHLHRLSQRADGPFVALNCAAIPENLIEAELFGVERGAFTGANQSRAGRFERAQGGTLFLDEIACLSLPGQGKLLRALQEREIERVGGSRTLQVDVRVIAATNLDLREAVRRGDFREDLFYRLNVYPIIIPPLRDRRDDVPLLVDLFLRRFCAAYDRPPVGLTMRALKALLRYDFPGNVRELQNLLERGVIASDPGELIDLPHLFRGEPLPTDLVEQAPAAGWLERLGVDVERPLHLGALEAELLDEALALSRGNVAAAARLLGLSRAQFAYRHQRARRDLD
ncbi:sigma 54-interacting transcriptional regulator [Pseudomonas oryzihabitans]|uniref:sigma 54-interacting transcriptional regulator n=1 Tax=Pseudomonas oryzihabitans TaxID=47885 RepID=UPI002863A0FC|nr:sigma 54-interacting transcriptional regulator [Pseudomonas psychrotolerans]MDR6677765.1 DNA-binding NtrC family response regulator [Pseudomonas psychrotolerans]